MSLLVLTTLPLDALSLEPHEWSYFLAASSPVVFQYSAKIRLLASKADSEQTTQTNRFSAGKPLQAGLYLAYTQTTHWDLWKWNDSCPMLESRYRPEVFWRFTPQTGPLAWLDAGLIHESNGLGGTRIADSRSWNRLSLSAGLPLLGSALILEPRLWCILSDTGNEQIGKYAGYGELLLKLDLPLGNSRLLASLRLRKGWSTALDQGNILIELAWQPWAGSALSSGRQSAFPISLVVQAFSGYGDTLIAYDTKEHHLRAGLGLVFDSR